LADERITLLDVEPIRIEEVRCLPFGSATTRGCLYVLSGELTVRLEDRELRAGAGSWVYVPPEVLHTFSVTGDRRTHFLGLHVPNSGFGDFIRSLYAADEDELGAVRAAFDLQPAPEYATGDPGLVVLRRSGGTDGEKISDRPDRRSTLLVDADELTVTEFFYGPGERGAQPHVHHRHADAFFILEGELTLTVGRGSLRAPAGTFVLFPPDVVHGFDNDGTESALFYNFHMPASGFADYMRGRNPDFDQHDPPADGGADPATAIAVRLPD
jgi:mannose-6-phosphate isomerase-like protein (cupin superfamily)